MLGTWWVTNKGFGAISGASRQLQRRGARDLTPIEVANPPRELEPFLEAMNGLLDQMRQAMAREREFTSLAAHELLTPLAAMRIQAQVLARTEAADERRARAAALMHSVDRCALLSTQLLNLARADAMVGSLAEVAPVRIDEACAEVLADFVADASRRRIDVACDLAAEQVLADRVGLQTLLRNLVGNAMRHTPDEGSIRIAASDESGRIVLRVEDSGEGIPEPERERVFQRFYRGRQSAGVGAGLGLAIVSSIVEAHRAVIALGRSPLGGLRVEVQFPRAAPA
jgi:signal transduction histidine kinase